MMKNKKAIAVLLLVAMLFSIMPTAVFAETDSVPFTATADGANLKVELSRTTYTHINWNSTTGSTVQLYIAYVPADAEEVTLNFGNENVLVYGYDTDETSSTYITPYDEYEDIMVGSSSALVTEENFGYYAEVQTPYDENWANELLYAVAFEYEKIDEVPFSVEAAGIKLDAKLFDKAYTHINWDGTEGATVDLYVVTLPEDAEVVTLDFGNEKVLVYGYDTNDSSSTYIAAYDEYEDIMVGSSSAVVTEENFGYYAEVQTPYDENWVNELLYAVAFDYEDISTPEFPTGEISIDKLLKNISHQYTEDASEWVIMDMAAYNSVTTTSAYQTSPETKQVYINNAISSINKMSVKETTYSKAILALTSISVNAQDLHPVNGTTIKALDALKCLAKDIKTNVTPYTLMSYNQGYGSGIDEIYLVKALIDLQCDDGEWVYDGNNPVDITGDVLAALAFYRNNNAVKDDVNKAIGDAVEFLKDEISTEGTYAENSNSTAKAVIGLAAIYDENITELFNQSVEGLLSFALADNSGFGYTNNTVKNSMATEQGFRALIAASQVMETGEAFNVYDFSANFNSLKPGLEEKINDSNSSGSGGSYVPKDDKITVKVSIKAIDGYWMQNKSVTLEEDATVSDALLQAIKGTGITQVGAENGYIESMEYNGMELGEFTHGDFSGWMYKVNGTAPNVGVTDYTLGDGDKILFYFTEDYTKEFMDDEDEKDEDKKDDESKPTTTPVTELVDDVDGHWAIEAIQYVYDRGLLTGISENEFAPDLAVTRAMMATIMYGMAGNPEHGWHYPFHDVFDMAWYAGPVAWAYENKLVYGVSDTSYAPETSITREQVAMMLMRYANFKGYDISQTVSLNHYKDAKNVSDYAESAMQWAVAIGMIGGRTADTLCAQDTATRAELSVMLRNFITLYETIDSNNSTTK